MEAADGTRCCAACFTRFVPAPGHKRCLECRISGRPAVLQYRACRWCGTIAERTEMIGAYCSEVCAAKHEHAKAHPVQCRCCGRDFTRTAERRCLCELCFTSAEPSRQWTED